MLCVSSVNPFRPMSLISVIRRITAHSTGPKRRRISAQRLFSTLLNSMHSHEAEMPPSKIDKSQIPSAIGTQGVEIHSLKTKVIKTSHVTGAVHHITKALTTATIDLIANFAKKLRRRTQTLLKSSGGGTALAVLDASPAHKSRSNVKDPRIPK